MFKRALSINGLSIYGFHGWFKFLLKKICSDSRRVPIKAKVDMLVITEEDQT